MPIPTNEIQVVELQQRGIITGGGAGEVRTNFVWHFRRLSTAVDPSKSAINTRFNATIGAAVVAALNEDWDASVNSIRYIDDALDAPTDFSVTASGAITGDRLASFATAYFLMRTALRGRNYRGSKHIGPFSESDVTHATGCDIFNAGCVTRLEAIAAAVLTGFTDSTGNVWVPVIVSRNLSQLSENPTVVVQADVVQCLPNHRVGSEVRRKAPSLY